MYKRIDIYNDQIKKEIKYLFYYNHYNHFHYNHYFHFKQSKQFFTRFLLCFLYCYNHLFIVSVGYPVLQLLRVHSAVLRGLPATRLGPGSGLADGRHLCRPHPYLCAHTLYHVILGFRF